MDRRVALANGISFTCLVQGSGPRLALLLHGFPDDPGAWRPLMARLADAGYTAVAPFMRGYGPTGPAPSGRYRITDLGADAVALVAALGFERAALIGHDWGASAAYGAAALAPERFTHLITLSVPPSRVFVSNLRRFPRQLRRSWYMLFFQLPGAMEWVRRRELAFVDGLWRAWSPGWRWPPERLAEAKAALAPPGRLEAALTYYRELIRRPLADPREARGTVEVAFRELAVPGLMLVGGEDGCIAPEMFTGAEAAFSAPARVEIIPGAGHFLPAEAPDEVWARVSAFLGEGGLGA